MKKRFALRLGAVSAAVFAASSSAFAALPAGVSAGITAIQTDGLDLVDLVWPVVIAFVGAAIVFKLFKRFTSNL